MFLFKYRVLMKLTSKLILVRHFFFSCFFSLCLIYLKAWLFEHIHQLEVPISERKINDRSSILFILSWAVKVILVKHIKWFQVVFFLFAFFLCDTVKIRKLPNYALSSGCQWKCMDLILLMDSFGFNYRCGYTQWTRNSVSGKFINP